MARVEKTVFISYRRKDISWALAVYQDLTHQGYDVFFDYTSIPSGDFEQIIISNIRARAHFVLILTPTTLDRCSEPGDWLRREIETAIDEKRNIIPMFFNGFNFGDTKVSEKLTGKLKNVSRYNGMNVHQDYFPEAMARLRTKFLSAPLTAVLHPISAEVQEVVLEEQRAADRAAEKKDVELKNMESIALRHELSGDFWSARKTWYEIKRIDPLFPRVDLKIKELEREIRHKEVKQEEGIKPIYEGKASKQVSSRISPRIFQIAGIIFIALVLFIFGGNFIIQSFSTHPTPTNDDSSIGLTTFGTDNMVLVFVPTGEFTMGSDTGESAEMPVHQVYLDAYWIDQTEVTNAMYKHCVDANQCNQPSDIGHFNNVTYANHPVIYVSWNDSVSYCEFVGRRLPTEAEWEKAARGTDGRTYPWGNADPKDNLLNFNNNVGDTTAVGSYLDGASIYGALDMSGNVWEWVNDWYDNTYYQSSPSLNPSGPSTGEYKVLRGGSWDFDSYGVRSALRNWVIPKDSNYYYVGFRCARNP